MLLMLLLLVSSCSGVYVSGYSETYYRPVRVYTPNYYPTYYPIRPVRVYTPTSIDRYIEVIIHLDVDKII